MLGRRLLTKERILRSDITNITSRNISFKERWKAEEVQVVEETHGYKTYESGLP